MRPQRRSRSAYDGLSDALRAFLARRAQELTGLILLAAIALVTAALATWSVDDPSLNNATDAPVKNLLGWPGAIVADLLMQLFGLGAIAALLPVALWGWRLIRRGDLGRAQLRLALWIDRGRRRDRGGERAAGHRPLAPADRPRRRLGRRASGRRQGRHGPRRRAGARASGLRLRGHRHPGADRRLRLRPRRRTPRLRPPPGRKPAPGLGGRGGGRLRRARLGHRVPRRARARRHEPARRAPAPARGPAGRQRTISRSPPAAGPARRAPAEPGRPRREPAFEAPRGPVRDGRGRRRRGPGGRLLPADPGRPRAGRPEARQAHGPRGAALLPGRGRLRASGPDAPRRAEEAARPRRSRRRPSSRTRPCSKARSRISASRARSSTFGLARW